MLPLKSTRGKSGAKSQFKIKNQFHIYIHYTFPYTYIKTKKNAHKNNNKKYKNINEITRYSCLILQPKN